VNLDRIPPDLRVKDVFHHIDMGFLNRRLCLTALPAELREVYAQQARPGDDHRTVLSNDHLLVTMLLDVCEAVEAPTLLQALKIGKPRHLFRSTERLEACPEVYSATRVRHDVLLDVNFGKPVRIAYHTSHLVSDTGTMTLAEGVKEGYMQSIVGLLHDYTDRFEIEPLVIGAPWLDHPRNGDDCPQLMWMGRDFGEILPEDIDQFSQMKEVQAKTADEWLGVMAEVPEAKVKEAFASLLIEPTKKDWGGETNDHFSGSISIKGQRKTAAFLFKGPTNFREMTLEMCGKRADQVYRLTNSGADISIVQHSHLIGEAVRATLRSLVFYPGRPRKYCLIDGQSTYRILKAYSRL
jgi:hypothetical protein